MKYVIEQEWFNYIMLWSTDYYFNNWLLIDVLYNVIVLNVRMFHMVTKTIGIML